MKILFSNPAWWTQGERGEWRAGIRAGSRWPFTMPTNSRPDAPAKGEYLPYPMFMGFAASWCQRAFPDAQVVLRDSLARRESYETFLNYVATFKPDFVVVETATPSWEHDKHVCKLIKEAHPAARIVITGTITTTRHEEIRSLGYWAIQGEYEKGVVEAITHETTPLIGGNANLLVEHRLLTSEEMNAAPFPMYDEEVALSYFDACPTGQESPELVLWTSRGCPFKCVSGDTLVNTVEGMIPIKDLVGRDGIGVYTYSEKERRVKISRAQNISKLGHEKLVRVHFDDNTHMDFTPDHKLLTFTASNQFVGDQETEMEACMLRPGMRVRAIKTYTCGTNRKYRRILWRRKRAESVHRIHAEWKYGRPITPGEIVHHKDHNPENNHPDNLEIVESPKAHFANHPEIAQRMRENNPAKSMTPEWAAKVAKANLGKVRTPESKERYRLAAIKREAGKSPEQKKRDNERMVAAYIEKKGWEKRPKKDGIPNHRVVMVEELPGTHDVYCLEVPETGWFYANNVLIRNCCFCAWPAVMTNNDPDGNSPRKVRFYSPEYIEGWIRARLAQNPGIKSIRLDDDTQNLGDKHTLGICEAMKRIGLPWSAMCRADTVKLSTWNIMQECGCFGVKIGMESGSQTVIDTIVNKKLDLGDIEHRILPHLKSIGLKVHTTWTVGLPGETPSQANETLRIIERLYQSGLHQTHQLSGTATIEGTPLDKIAQGQELKAYPGADNRGFLVTGDGQDKVERMARLLK